MVATHDLLVSILKVIERLREEMHQTADLKGLSHPDVLRTRSRIVAMSFCEPRSCRLQLSS